MKSIILLLLLILFFLSGMLFGVERDRTEVSSSEIETVDNDDSEGPALEEEAVIQTSGVAENSSPDTSDYKQTSSHFTQKMAAFFETIVKGFYEIVVQMIYQIVQLFY